MGTLDQAKAERLSRIAGMFGSAHDGERAAAALKFDEALKAEGLTLSDILATFAARRPAPVVPTRKVRPLHQDQADAVFASTIPISEWERAFLATVRTAETISAKQGTILSKLYSKAVEASR